MTLDTVLHSRENRIDQIRLGAALAVFVGHSWHIAQGPQAVVPLENFLRIGFHELAVFIFFFLSGMLISESARRNETRMGSFIWARARRLLPALCVNAICIPLLLIATGAWSPASLGGMVEYAARLITLISVDYARPEVFSDLPFAHAINGSVWSLRHEVFVYALIGGGALVGMFQSGWRFYGLCLVFSGWCLAGLAIAGGAQSGLGFILAEGRYLAFACLLGCLAHRYARIIPIDGLPAANIALLLLSLTATAHLFLAESVYCLCLIALLSYLTLLLAYAGAGPKRGLPYDVSYGVYIYAWPLQQLTVDLYQRWLGMPPEPQILIALALPPVMLAGYLSWIWVERPALSIKCPDWLKADTLFRALRERLGPLPVNARDQS